MCFQEQRMTPKLNELLEERLEKAFAVKKPSGKGHCIPAELRVVGVVRVDFQKKDKQQLGISHRHGFVVRVNTESPFKGSVKTGDMILMVNGSEVKFDEKATGPEMTQGPTNGSGRSKVKSARKKTTVPRPEFKDLVQKIFTENQNKDVVRFELTLGRLRTRTACRVAKNYTPKEDFGVETVILYQFKYLKLGLNMQQFQDSVIVNYTMPDTTSHMSLFIGETILKVDGKETHTLTDVRDQILEKCNLKGYAELLVEYPITDPMRNSIRNRLTGLMNVSVDRVNFAYGQDTNKYCQEGIEALKNCKEPAGILKGSVAVQKKPSTRKANTPKKDNLKFQQKIAVHDVPTDWNSQLFVWLPGPKTLQSETGGAPKQ